MGALISRNRVASDNYEQILSNLDNDIQQKEIQLSDIRVKDRRVGILWILYSTILWIIYILYYLYAFHGKYEDVQTVALTVCPIILGPLCIFYFRKCLKWIYYKRLSSIETSLTALRKQQKLKVEELKKKTAYYSTKSLLERYDPTSEKKKELDEQKKKKMIQEKEQQQKKKQVNNGTVPQPPQMNMVGVQPLVKQQPQQAQWYDKIVDALVGDSGPEEKYALICTHCYAHNGLVLPQEVDSIQYTCPHCHKFNPSRKSRMLHPDGPVLPPMSPPTTSDDGESDSKKEEQNISNNNNINESTALKKDTPIRQRIAASTKSD